MIEETQSTEASGTQESAVEEPKSTMEVETNESSQEDQPKKKKGGFQKRIDKLNKRTDKLFKKVEETSKDRDYWRQKALEYESLKGSSPQAQAQPIPEAIKKPDPNNFETNQEYLDAYADWKFEVKMKEQEIKRAQEEAKRAAQNQLTNHQQRVEKFKKEKPETELDFKKWESMKHSSAAIDFIVESDHGPDLILEFSKNPDEYDRINKLSYSRATKELGKLELRFEKAKEEVVETKEPKEAKKSSENKSKEAPRPINPVKATGTTVPKSEYDPDIEFTEYKRLREEQFRNSMRR